MECDQPGLIMSFDTSGVYIIIALLGAAWLLFNV
jgi:hypothetical protein